MTQDHHDDDASAPPSPLAGRALRVPVLWGIAFGVIQAAAPLGFWWLDPAGVGFHHERTATPGRLPFLPCR